MNNECLRKQRREKTYKANKMGRIPLHVPRCHRMAGQIQISSDLESADSAISASANELEKQTNK